MKCEGSIRQGSARVISAGTDMSEPTDLKRSEEFDGWPAPVTVLNEHGASDLALICEHASNFVPSSYDGLGLSHHQLRQHIAYDLGAAELTVALSTRLDAPAFLGNYSRLLVDLNRPPGVPSSMPVISERTDIPGNENLQQDEIDRRLERIFYPFHQRISDFLIKRRNAKRRTVLVSIHSFSPVYAGEWRPFHVGVLFERSAELALSVLRALRRTPNIVAEANVPYHIQVDGDYTVPVHGTRTNTPILLIEVRNDGLATQADVDAWSTRIAAAFEGM